MPLRELQEALRRRRGPSAGACAPTRSGSSPARSSSGRTNRPEGSSKTFCSSCGSNLFGGGWPDSEHPSVRLTTPEPPYEGKVGSHIFVRSLAPWEVLPDDAAERYEVRSRRATDRPHDRLRGRRWGDRLPHRRVRLRRARGAALRHGGRDDRTCGARASTATSSCSRRRTASTGARSGIERRATRRVAGSTTPGW